MPNDFFKSRINNGEAFFASSNSNLIHIGKELVFVATDSFRLAEKRVPIN